MASIARAIVLDQPRDRLDPPALTEAAQSIHDQILAEWDAEEFGDIHERFADWVRGRLTIDELCEALVARDQYTQAKLRPMEGIPHSYALMLRRRKCGHPFRGPWECVTAQDLWTALDARDADAPLAEAFIEREFAGRLAEAGERWPR